MAQSESEAARWYRKAAEQGGADPQFKLRACLNKKNAWPERFYKSAVASEKKTDQKSAKAQCNLGIALIFGKGVPAENRFVIEHAKKSSVPSSCRKANLRPDPKKVGTS